MVKLLSDEKSWLWVQLWAAVLAVGRGGSLGCGLGAQVQTLAHVGSWRFCSCPPQSWERRFLECCVFATKWVM